ncbi:hypothetical protein ISN44_As01g034270 [Arabidopsis suecica]|uniref:Uncharacterized protein n=1 Tax=Arabidopsis suecica TaxID=45249 RepID=A0A8T2HAB4_ARASU|nr:hypothetical protein ISN44_As01g034270 [Arabidopsis suecica]
MIFISYISLHLDSSSNTPIDQSSLATSHSYCLHSCIATYLTIYQCLVSYIKKTGIELEMHGWDYEKPINPDYIRLNGMCEVTELLKCPKSWKFKFITRNLRGYKVYSSVGLKILKGQRQA